MFSDSPTILLPLKTSNYWESTIKRVLNLLHEVLPYWRRKKKIKFIVLHYIERHHEVMIKKNSVNRFFRIFSLHFHTLSLTRFRGVAPECALSLRSRASLLCNTHRADGDDVWRPTTKCHSTRPSIWHCSPVAADGQPEPDNKVVKPVKSRNEYKKKNRLKIETKQKELYMKKKNSK